MTSDRNDIVQTLKLANEDVGRSLTAINTGKYLLNVPSRVTHPAFKVQQAVAAAFNVVQETDQGAFDMVYRDTQVDVHAAFSNMI